MKEEKKQIGGAIWRANEGLQNIAAELEETGGELTPEIESRLAAISCSNELIADNLQALIAKAKGEAEMIDAEIKRLQALKKSRNNAVEGIKRYLLHYMINNGIRCIEGTYAKISVAAGRESVEVDSDALVNAVAGKIIAAAQKRLPAYVNIKAEISKSVLLDYLHEGKPMPTIEGDPFARVEKTPYLLIK